MSGRRSSSGGGGVSMGLVILLLVLLCGLTAVIAYFYIQSNQEQAPVVLPTSASVANLPTAEPTTSLIATNTPAPTQQREAITTVDNSTALAATAVTQAQETQSSIIFLTQTRPFIPTHTPRPANTGVPTSLPVVTVAPTVINTAVPTQAPASNWQGEYFANPDLSDPVAFFRQDALINFNWGTGSPGQGIPNDYFSIRWEKIVALSPGTYRFYTRADDGVRVWLNDQLIIDRWQDATDKTYSTTQTVSQTNNSLRVEYFEGLGDAQIQFWWEREGDFPDWRGQYYANKTLNESGLALTRNDTAVNFQWGYGAPVSDMPVDNFSARWNRTIYFDQDTYRFFATVDDGVRIYVDGKLILDEWEDGGVRTVSAATNLSSAEHIIIVEYYENITDAQIRVWWEKDMPTATPSAVPLPTSTIPP